MAALAKLYICCWLLVFTARC